MNGFILQPPNGINTISKGWAANYSISISGSTIESQDAHPLRERIKMIQRSSKDQIVINQVRSGTRFQSGCGVLDSIHTHTRPCGIGSLCSINDKWLLLFCF